MKFTCTKENLNQGLHIVTGIASKPSNLPILSNILIVATESGVELASTNLEISVKAYVRAKTEIPGSFTVPAKTFLDYVGLLTDERVEVELKNNELSVRGGSSSTKIKGLPSDEYPVIPDVEEVHAYTMTCADLKRTLSQVVFAAAKNDIRPELSGVYVSFAKNEEKTLTVAATDSYRLAEARMDMLQGTDEMVGIVPARTIQECIRLLSLKSDQEDEQTVRIWVSDSQIAMRHNLFEMNSRLIDGHYPDYTQIIPAEYKTTAHIDKDVLSNSMKAASLFTTSGVNAVALSLQPKENIVHVSSTSTQTGEHDASIDADISGEDNSILLNHRYVLEGLSHMETPKVLFEMNSPDTPCLFKPKGESAYLYIVMPIRQ
ncbi:MAG: DNA polymerase III subunit beta [Candidatus Magasanikbacteria bacterium CG10_big_fil_rev_8_21_14_0_10_47_10]|uniref:Beta sliding clamp n=1 Tax=Candidatus Magasanikbacteria bacterium CG10_big_fil_rev_8_21_14_0_10_47_10 TaxID=1974652 RepID=A0A2H0TTV8_9BACT|nr:MAG: DNA polymerase III subunit beta [Candidatus Magasanikbacteria bacterium CG10_big_fil_rev_8_21_14_0_10_47_10]